MDRVGSKRQHLMSQGSCRDSPGSAPTPWALQIAGQPPSSPPGVPKSGQDGGGQPALASGAAAAAAGGSGAAAPPLFELLTRLLLLDRSIRATCGLPS